jgi:DNA repair exonuclease SbcCD ATPase subunit
MHNDGGRVIIMGSGISPQPQIKERIVYRDRVVYRDRPTFNKEKTERVRELEEKVQNLKQQLRKSADHEKLQRLENKIKYYEYVNQEQKEAIEQLQNELDATDRVKLLKKIEDLKEELQRSRNRERTSREQQYAKGYQAGVVDGSNRKKEVFDWGVRPTKEQAEAFIKQLRIFLDCEE